MKEFQIRTATPKDAEAVLAVYAPYIQNTAITFEYNVPPIEEFERRISETLEHYPYLVAEHDGEIWGYAYASQFHPRAACRWDVEVSVYIRQDKKKLGIGRSLYETLEQILKQQNYLNINASIAYTEDEDPYLTKDSVRFHEHMGFQWVGEFHKCGYKFGRWYSLIWMEKHIGEHSEKPNPVTPFCEIRGGQKNVD